MAKTTAPKTTTPKTKSIRISRDLARTIAAGFKAQP